jgi:hypothetical protein
MTQQGDELLKQLISRGCTTKAIDGITLVSLPDDEAEFVFELIGDWLYLGTTFMGPEEFETSEYEGQLNRFLLELQHRNLGCRFSYDGAGFLTIGGELDPDHQQADDVLQMLAQILFIIESCIHLCDQVLDTGQIPGDREVDEVFGVNEHLH